MVWQVFELVITHGFAHLFVRGGRSGDLRTLGDVPILLDFGINNLDIIRDLLLFLRRVPIFVLLLLECLGRKQVSPTLFDFFYFVLVFL